MARTELQERYIAIVQEVNRVSKKLAEYWADQSSEEQMQLHVNWYDRQKEEK